MASTSHTTLDAYLAQPSSSNMDFVIDLSSSAAGPSQTRPARERGASDLPAATPHEKVLRPRRVAFDSWRWAAPAAVPLQKRDIGAWNIVSPLPPPTRPSEAYGGREQGAISIASSSAGPAEPRESTPELEQHATMVARLMRASRAQRSRAGVTAFDRQPQEDVLEASAVTDYCRPLPSVYREVQEDIREEEIASASWAKRRIREGCGMKSQDEDEDDPVDLIGKAPSLSSAMTTPRRRNGIAIPRQLSLPKSISRGNTAELPNASHFDRMDLWHEDSISYEVSDRLRTPSTSNLASQQASQDAWGLDPLLPGEVPGESSGEEYAPGQLGTDSRDKQRGEEQRLRSSEIPDSDAGDGTQPGIERQRYSPNQVAEDQASEHVVKGHTGDHLLRRTVPTGRTRAPFPELIIDMSDPSPPPRSLMSRVDRQPSDNDQAIPKASKAKRQNNVTAATSNSVLGKRGRPPGRRMAPEQPSPSRIEQASQDDMDAAPMRFDLSAWGTAMPSSEEEEEREDAKQRKRREQRLAATEGKRKSRNGDQERRLVSTRNSFGDAGPASPDRMSVSSIDRRRRRRRRAMPPSSPRVVTSKFTTSPVQSVRVDHRSHRSPESSKVVESRPSSTSWPRGIPRMSSTSTDGDSAGVQRAVKPVSKVSDGDLRLRHRSGMAVEGEDSDRNSMSGSPPPRNHASQWTALNGVGHDRAPQHSERQRRDSSESQSEGEGAERSRRAANGKSHRRRHHLSRTAEKARSARARTSQYGARDMPIAVESDESD